MSSTYCFLKMYFIYFTSYLYVFVLCVCRWLCELGIRYPWVEIPGSCEPSEIGIMNQSWVLYESNKY